MRIKPNKGCTNVWSVTRLVSMKLIVQIKGSVCFDWIWFPEINFRKIARLAALENSVKLKTFSVWPENTQKTTEIWFSRYFRFKHFPETRTSSHKLSPRTRTSSRLSPSALLSHGSALWSLHCAGTTHTDAPRSRSRRTGTAPIDVDHDRDRADRHRSRDRLDRDHRNQRDRDRDLADLARSVDRRFARRDRKSVV